LDIHKKTIVNKFEFGDSSRIADGEGKFKFKTKEGARIGGIATGIHGCICLDIQRFEGHSTRITSTLN
jgi:hypothetical protein